MLHYFVDGDLWGVNYDRSRRPLACWEEGDIISVEVGIFARIEDLKNRFQEPVIAVEKLIYNTHHQICKSFKISPAITLSHEDYKKGYRVYMVLYKNYFVVHNPMYFNGLYGDFYIGAKFAEFKDKIKIIKEHRAIND